MSVPPDQITPVPPDWRSVAGTALRLLTFQASKADLLHLTSKHLYLGLLSTWIVGIGRYWDNPVNLIIVTLTLLNLEKVVFDFMRGIIDPSPNDEAYLLLITLTYIAFFMFLPIVLCYIVLAASKLTIFRRSWGVLSDSIDCLKP